MPAKSSHAIGLVQAERRGPVLLLTFDRPDQLNAWDDELEDRYFDLLDAAEDDTSVRAVVVTGAGRAFCSGALMSDLQRGGAEGVVPTLTAQRRPRHLPLTLRKPLIAAINGPAVGLGLVEALFADVRFAVPDARLATIFARRGLIAEYGLSWLLPRLVGYSRAADLLLSGRFVLGDEAVRMGLVDHLVTDGDVVGAAVAYATELATYSSPRSMSVIKAQLQADLDVDLVSARERADRLLVESFAAADVKEGVASFVERRAPAFPPLPPRNRT